MLNFFLFKRVKVSEEKRCRMLKGRVLLSLSASYKNRKNIVIILSWAMDDDLNIYRL